MSDIIRINVPGAFISPWSRTFLMKHPQGDLKPFLLTSLGSTLVWKYALLRSILLLYLALPSEFRIIFWFGMVSSSLMFISFLAVRSTGGLMRTLSFFSWVNIGAAPLTPFRSMIHGSIFSFI